MYVIVHMTINMKFMMLTTNQVVCITFLNWQRALLGLIFIKRYCNILFVFFIIIEVAFMKIPNIRLIAFLCNWNWTNVSYLVTLNVLRRRTHLNTDRPSGCIISFLVRTSSAILLITTKKSNRLKRETKYPWNEMFVLYQNVEQSNYNVC